MIGKWRSGLLALAAGMGFSVGAALAADLRIGLFDDPDVLDPAFNRTTPATAVLTTMCERLVWADAGLALHPGLATSWSWSDDGKVLTVNLAQGVNFQDGTPFNAEAVKFNIEREMTAQGSMRKQDLSTIGSIEAPGPTKLVITVKQPSAQLLATFAERVGVILSPTAVQKMGENIGRAPVCAGPYKFVERVAQDHVTLQKDPSYYKASQYAFDRVIFRTIKDDSVRLANLQSGDVDLIDRLDPSLVQQVQKDTSLQLIPVNVANIQALMLNLAADTPLKDPRVREALELSLDRQAIVDVAFAGRYVATNQFGVPGSPYYDASKPVPARDVVKAKALLKAAGYTAPIPLEVMVWNQPLIQRVGQMIQAMTSEAGFATKLDVADFATTLKLASSGSFQAFGPVGADYADDPDRLVSNVLYSTGSNNFMKYKSPEMDALLDSDRATTDPAKRNEVFKQIAGLVIKDKPVIYMYAVRPIIAAKVKLKNIHTSGDGFLMLDGTTMQ